MSNTNPFLDPEMAAGYEGWYETVGRRAGRLEKALLRKALARFPRARSLLEVGCGTGHFTRWFAAQNLQAVGLDVSAPMLAQAAARDSEPYVMADALALPFPECSIDLVAFVTTLEFVSEAQAALQEAARVARLGLILGVLNKHSLLGWRYKRSGLLLWQQANFFSVGELQELLHRALPERPFFLFWRTTLWPLWPGDLPLPWGGFIVMATRFS